MLTSDMQYPEHEKLQALNGKNRTVGEFMDWLRSAGGYTLCKETSKEVKDSMEELNMPVQEFLPATTSTVNLIAEFFEIDQNKLEAEKLQMLAEIRQQP